jgi:hypothetical protein
VRRSQPHPSAAAKPPCCPPILCLEAVRQRNLLLQFVERLTSRGLLASKGRIRCNSARSQVTMVGARRKCRPVFPAHSQHHKLISRRCTHRRTVEASGERAGSLQCGAACSAVSPAATRSHASCRQRRLKCPDGASQSGKIVKVFLQGRQIPRHTQMLSCCSSCDCRSRRPWPMIVSSRHSGHSRGSRCNGTTAAQCCLWRLAVR